MMQGVSVLLGALGLVAHRQARLHEDDVPTSESSMCLIEANVDRSTCSRGF